MSISRRRSKAAPTVKTTLPILVPNTVPVAGSHESISQNVKKTKIRIFSPNRDAVAWRSGQVTPLLPALRT